MSDRTVLSREDVERHERWLTALVQRLVTRSEVADVVQDTWLAAMEQPDRRPGTTRAWLARVARNFAISRWQTRRRQRRSEAGAARHEAVPSTAETVDRLATFEMLLGVVRELPEPYRTAVLLQHYHGLAVHDVAARLGVSEAAARQRTKRGLDAVRRRLAERTGPGWRERLGAVLPLVVARAVPPAASAATAIGSATAPVTTLGILMMNAKTMLLCSAAGVLAGGAVLVAVLSSPATPGAAPPPAEVASERLPEPAVDATPAVQRTAVDSALLAEETPAVWSGRVLDVRGAPVPGVGVLEAGGEQVAETDATGRFTCAQRDRADVPHLDPRFCTVRRHVREPDQGSSEELVFIVAPSVRVGGVVSDRSGEPLGDVKIVVEMRALLEFPAPLERTRPVALPHRETGAAGEFEFPSLPGSVCRLRFEKTGYQSTVHDVGDRSDPALRVVLDDAEGGSFSITGQVLDAVGWPVADAVVGLGNEQVHSDLYGRYALASTREDLENADRAFYVAKPGSRTQVSTAPRIEEFDADQRLERDLTLPGPALTIRGTVLGPDGQPIAGAVVALWRLEPMPGADFAEELAVAPEVEPQELGIAPRRVYAVSDDAGAFTLGGLCDRDYRLRVLHEDHLAMTSAPIRAGATGVELRYPADNIRAMRCRVVNTRGEPMPGLRIDTSMQVHQTTGTSSWDVVDDLRTGDDGSVVLPRVLRSEATQVRVRGDAIITAIEMIEPNAAEPFEVVVERRCHFRVECTDPRLAEATFQLETASGEMAWISKTRGTYNAQLQLVDGKTPVLTTSELATTLVVNGTERVPITLVPGEVAVVRF